MKKGLFAVGFLLSVSFGFAQTTTVTIHNDGWEESNETESRNKKNAIKIAPLNALIGEFPVFYERALSDVFSAEIGLGFTNRNYLGFLNDNSFDIDFTDNVNTVTYNSHFMYKLGMRAFFDDGAPDGKYLALEYASKKYSYDAPIVTNTQTGTTTDFKSTKEQKEYKLIYGYQDLYWYDNLFFDSYIGFGMVERTITVPVESYNNSATSYKYETTKGTVPSFYFGVKVGFAF